MHHRFYDDQDRRYLSWRLGSLLLVASAVVASVLTWGALSLAKPSSAAVDDGRAEAGEVTTGQAVAGTAGTSCSEAVALAEEALVHAREIDRSLAAQTQVVNELVVGRASAEEVLDRALPGLTRGQQRSTAFGVADQAFQAAAPACG